MIIKYKCINSDDVELIEEGSYSDVKKDFPNRLSDFGEYGYTLTHDDEEGIIQYVDTSVYDHSERPDIKEFIDQVNIDKRDKKLKKLLND